MTLDPQVAPDPDPPTESAPAPKATAAVPDEANGMVPAAAEASATPLPGEQASRPQRGDELELTIDSLAFGGEGVARLGDGGYVVFVAGAIPGDRVRAVVHKRKRSYAHARAVEILEPSPERIAPRADHPVHGHFWIPIDDENCWAWSFDYLVTKPLTDEQVRSMKDGKGIYVTYVPGTFRPARNKDNDYLIDRDAQRVGRSYSGVWGIAMQDASLQESMGPIVDRTKENLVSTDNGIIMARHRLLRATKMLMDKGTIPPGVDVAHQQVRSAALVLRPDEHFTEAAKDALTVQAGTAHASV